MASFATLQKAVERMEADLYAMKKALSELSGGEIPEPKKMRKARKAPDSDAPKRESPWSRWTKYVVSEFKEDYEAFRSENPDMRGPVPKFASQYKEKNPEIYARFIEEYNTTKASSETEKPVEKPKKTLKAPKASAEVENPKEKEETEAPKAEAKKPKMKLTKKSQEHKATPAPEPITEPVIPKSSSEEEDDGVARIWTFRGKKYLKTSMGECWLAREDGSMGTWAGIYNPVEDKIDDSAPEPEIEME
jgi:hypothetical protein